MREAGWPGKARFQRAWGRPNPSPTTRISGRRRGWYSNGAPVVLQCARPRPPRRCHIDGHTGARHGFPTVFGGHRHATRWLADRLQHPRGYFCHSACFGPPAGASGACRQPASRRTSEQGGSLAAESRRTEQLTGPGGRSACTPTISRPLALLQASTSARRPHRVNASHLGPSPPCRGVGGNISG